MPQIEQELHPVDSIITNASGQPGARTFYLQATKGNRIITLIIEKFQLQALAAATEQFLSDIKQEIPDIPDASSDYQEQDMELIDPLEPLFRVGDFGLGYDSSEDKVILVFREAPQEEGTVKEIGAVRMWCSRTQLLRLARWGMELVKRGRPICPLCGEIIDPGGHLCPKKNGHKKSRVINDGQVSHSQ